VISVVMGWCRRGAGWARVQLGLGEAERDGVGWVLTVEEKEKLAAADCNGWALLGNEHGLVEKLAASHGGLTELLAAPIGSTAG
jgi:hypothetical protein